MSIPTYEDNGGIQTGVDASVDVAFPATVNSNDILIVQLLDADNDSFTTTGDWVEIYQEGANSNASHAYYWLRAGGTETGTHNFTSGLTAGSGVYGVMSRFSGCITSGTPYENEVGQAVVQTNTPTIPALIAGHTDSLAVGFLTIEDNITVTGASAYTEAYQLTSTVGGDANLTAWTQEAQSNRSAEALTLATNEYTGILGLMLISPTSTPITATRRIFNIS